MPNGVSQGGSGERGMVHDVYSRTNLQIKCLHGKSIIGIGRNEGLDTRDIELYIAKKYISSSMIMLCFFFCNIMWLKCGYETKYLNCLVFLARATRDVFTG